MCIRDRYQRRVRGPLREKVMKEDDAKEEKGKEENSAGQGVEGGDKNDSGVADRPIVFFDVTIGDQLIGRIKFQLYSDIVPRTAENFRQFCTGEFRKNNKPLGYKGCSFHRIIKGFMIQGGDFINGDGTGTLSIYGSKFDDENFTMKHTKPGLLSMAHSGKDTNGCQFFITCDVAPWLDDKHVVFGEVIEDGLKIVRMIENVSVYGKANKPKLQVKVSQCGQY
eukprot:TRINITY_DN4648_c0_g1_i1.p1 TRINITY_DN4648_c0_g1~~TRINITY_DN4648_c0_g1_i1.p1  ORF type:complete len:223 (-),score=39.55 TRINITY_DN4648_c0_g1_i1:347-1015(-)